MKIPKINRLAAIILAASACPTVMADPAVQSSPDKRPPTTDTSGGRGNSDANNRNADPDEKGDARSTDKPGASSLPRGGRGNDNVGEMPAREADSPTDSKAERRKTDDKEEPTASERKKSARASGSSADEIVAQWPERPSLGARTLISKYGDPDSATEEMLVWHDKGPYVRICISKQEHHHDFPKPHTDFMQHTISYAIPEDKASELTKYDGSVTFDRTQGELSARCDVEAHNILSLNLANDVATGKLSAEEARKKFSELVVQESAGEKPDYLASLQFKPKEGKATDSDRPTIPGASQRENATAKTGSDAEILGMIVAVDENEIGASSVAASKKLAPEVAEFAVMIHKMHGENLAKTLKLGSDIEIAPAETSKVDTMRKEAAGELSAIVELNGSEFEAGFINLMVKGHAKVLEKIDDELLKQAKNEDLIKHLRDTREEVSTHLEAAKKLQRTAQR